MSSTFKVLVLMGLLITPIICYHYVREGSRLCTFVTAYYYDYNEMYELSYINDPQLMGYYAKVPISITTKFGDIHIILSETDELIDNNRCYEFAIGRWDNTKSEIRRKDSIHEINDMVQNIFYPYIVPLDSEKNIELSVSNDLDTYVEFNLTDQMDAIPVKYISFAGFRGHETKFSFNCTFDEGFSENEFIKPEDVVLNDGFRVISMWPMCIGTIIVSCLLYQGWWNPIML